MVLQAKGALARTILDFESAYGVSPAAPAGKNMPFNKNQVAVAQKFIDTNTITGNRNEVPNSLGRRTVDGQLELPLDLRAIGWWLRLLMGAPTTTGEAGGPYTHIFKIDPTADLPSAVIATEYPDAGVYHIYNGCKAGSFKLSFGDDGELVYTIDIAGAKYTSQVAAYDADAESVTIERISAGMASIKEGGATTAIVLSGDININNNLDTSVFIVGPNNTRGFIPEGKATVSGSLKTIFADEMLLAKGTSGTKSSLELKYTSGVHSLAFSIPELQYDVADVGVPSQAGLTADLNYRGYWANDAGNSSLIVTLINDVASYA